ncbi:hypothetical protein F3K43_48255 [Streptomyces sp. LBUM 1476]|nr:hypothetical protein [Streptomyces sp. LBUM 1476]
MTSALTACRPKTSCPAVEESSVSLNALAMAAITGWAIPSPTRRPVMPTSRPGTRADAAISVVTADRRTIR